MWQEFSQVILQEKNINRQTQRLVLTDIRKEVFFFSFEYIFPVG